MQRQISSFNMVSILKINTNSLKHRVVLLREMRTMLFHAIPSQFVPTNHPPPNHEKTLRNVRRSFSSKDVCKAMVLEKTVLLVLGTTKSLCRMPDVRPSLFRKFVSKWKKTKVLMDWIAD